MRELGSPHRNVRVYTCLSRVLKFEITATYHCILCGETLPLKEVQAQQLELADKPTRIKVCTKCADRYSGKKIVW